MKKYIAATLLFLGVLLGSLSTATAAQAYGPNTPPVTPPHVPSQGTPKPHDGVLPNTGGPNVLILAGAVVLLVAGGVVLASRRRTTN